MDITVRISKREGVPVQFLPADDPRGVAAVRDVDLQRKYHFSASELAQHVDLTPPRALALRRHLNIDENEDDVHIFSFGPLKITRYSDNALVKMRAALAEVDMDEVWRLHRPRRRQQSAGPCVEHHRWGHATTRPRRGRVAAP